MSDATVWFQIFKTVHVTTVVVTLTGFVTRGIWMLQDSPLLQTRAARTLPHVNDTILLLSALSAAAIIDQYPFVDGWLTAKAMGLLAYIVFGAIALTYGPSRRIRLLAFTLALLSFAYVVAVALTKNSLLN